MEDNIFRRLIDRDELIVDQDKSNPAIFRISWFKDYHYQGEIYISLIDTKYDKPYLSKKHCGVNPILLGRLI